MRAYDVYVKGQRLTTQVRIHALNKSVAVASFAFSRGLKTIDCDAILRSKKNRGVK